MIILLLTLSYYYIISIHIPIQSPYLQWTNLIKSPFWLVQSMEYTTHLHYSLVKSQFWMARPFRSLALNGPCPKNLGQQCCLLTFPWYEATPSANKQKSNFGIWTFLEVRFQTQDIEQFLKRHAVKTWNLRTLIFSRSDSSKNRQEKHWGKMGQQNFRKMLAYFNVGVVYWSVLACGLFIFCSACICFLPDMNIKPRNFRHALSLLQSFMPCWQIRSLNPDLSIPLPQSDWLPHVGFQCVCHRNPHLRCRSFLHSASWPLNFGVAPSW